MLSLSEILAIAVGLFFVYLLLSIVTSYAVELISTTLQMRGSNLADAIQKLLDPSVQVLEGKKQILRSWTGDKADIWLRSEGQEEDVANELLDLDLFKSNPVKAFYQHPIIKSLSRPKRMPSYITAQDFSTALMDMIMRIQPGAVTQPEQYFQHIKTNVQRLPKDLKRSLLPLIENAEMSESDANRRLAQLRRNIEGWYTTTTERATGWYKQKTQLIGILIGMFVAFMFNADTIGISQSLWRDAALRSSSSQAALVYMEQGNTDQVKATLNSLSALALPIGWRLQVADRNAATPPDPREIPASFGEIFFKLVGLVLTGLAISQGSSLWFDILNRAINFRGSAPGHPMAGKRRAAPERAVYNSPHSADGRLGSGREG